MESKDRSNLPLSYVYFYTESGGSIGETWLIIYDSAKLIYYQVPTRGQEKYGKGRPEQRSSNFFLLGS